MANKSTDEDWNTDTVGKAADAITAGECWMRLNQRMRLGCLVTPFAMPAVVDYVCDGQGGKNSRTEDRLAMSVAFDDRLADVGASSGGSVEIVSKAQLEVDGGEGGRDRPCMLARVRVPARIRADRPMRTKMQQKGTKGVYRVANSRRSATVRVWPAMYV